MRNDRPSHQNHTGTTWGRLFAPVVANQTMSSFSSRASTRASGLTSCPAISSMLMTDGRRDGEHAERRDGDAADDADRPGHGRRDARTEERGERGQERPPPEAPAKHPPPPPRGAQKPARHPGPWGAP